MTISHQEYLEKQIYSKTLTLNELAIRHRISLAEYNVTKELLEKEISSMTRQLMDTGIS